MPSYTLLSKKISTITTFIFVLLALSGVFFAGVYVDDITGLSNSVESQEQESFEIRESGYSFINPLLECEVVSNQGNTKLATLDKRVSAIAQTKKDQKVSLYYRDLLNGPWYGYNEDAAFAPQSLLKLPIIFAYLKLADENSLILQTEILYDVEKESNLPDAKKLPLNASYTVETLIERTIQLSDNVAFSLLVEHLPQQFVEKVHQDLNIPFPSLTTPTDFVSVKSYSSVFRVLYNSSYLTRKNSEYLLALLSDSDFESGIVAGVPEGTLVAHKFGIKNADDSSEQQLHDCGIVYHPKHPYLICVMTKGTNHEAQSQTIQELSEAVYRTIDEQK